MRVVNQPFVFGWHDGALHIQAFDVLEDDPRDWKKAQAKLLNKALAERIQQELKTRKEKIDWDAVSKLTHDPRGIPGVGVRRARSARQHRRDGDPRAEQGGAGRNLGWHLRPAGRRGHVPGARVRSRVFGGIRRRGRRACADDQARRQLTATFRRREQSPAPASGRRP